MQRHPGAWFVSCLATLIVTTSGAAWGDWPGYMGPNGDGRTQSQSPIARQWPADGPRQLWSQSLGVGFGAPAIRDGQVFLLDRENDQQDVLRCFDLQTGEALWRFAYDAPGRLSYNGSRSTPTVTEKQVFIVGPFGDVHAIDRATHEPIWRRRCAEFEGSPPNWGYANSPLVLPDRVIVAPQSNRIGLAALSRETGDTLWTTPGLGGYSYASPMLVKLAGVDQILFISRLDNQKGQLTAVNPDTGEILWKYNNYYCKNMIPNPTVLGDDRIFLTGGYNAGSQIIHVQHNDESWRVQTEAQLSEYGAQIHPALAHEGHLYVNLNENSNLRRNPRGLACLSSKGELLWQTGAEPDINRGALIMVDGLILSMGGGDGVLRLIKASPEGRQLLAQSAMFDDLKERNNQIWAPMAFSRGKLIIRSQHELKCIDLTKP